MPCVSSADFCTSVQPYNPPAGCQLDRNCDHQSATVLVSCSIPQGSVIGPVIQFISYTEDITTLSDKHGIKRHHRLQMINNCLPQCQSLMSVQPRAILRRVSQMSRPGVHLADCSSTRLRQKLSGLEPAIASATS